MDDWSRWLFQEHSEAELRAWARRLSVFRFVRATGGHANDRDELVAAYRYSSPWELREALTSLGILEVTHSTPPPQPEPGRSYGWDEFAAFPALIPGTLTEQPQWQRIDAQPVFIWCSGDELRFSVGEEYGVDELCVERAQQIEPALAFLTLTQVEPPVDRRHCISPKYYPAYFG